MTRTFLFGRSSTLSLAVGALLLACSKPPAPEARPPREELVSRIDPATMVASFRRLPSAHFHGSTRFLVRPQKPSGSPDAVPVAPDAVTTTTDVWIDGRGFFRLLETNDQDGGREVTFLGEDLTVALRYLRPVRRPAREPEPTRLLTEALGGPFAAWDTVRRFAQVTRDPKDPHHLVIGKSDVAIPDDETTAARPSTPLRRWRESVVVHTLKGEARLDPKTGTPLVVALEAVFSATRDGTPLHGEISVRTAIDHVGRVAALNAPDAGVLEPRQRTVLEERALLEGLAPVAREKGAR